MSAIWILICAIAGIFASAQLTKDVGKEGTTDQRTTLYRQLLENYEMNVNPDKPNVNFGLSLINLDIDEGRSTLETNIWVKMVWHDSRLKWNTTEYPVSLLRLDYNTIWHPDITLYNSADLSISMTSACWQSNVLVYPSGKVLWVPPCHFSSFCKLTLTTSPFESQTCFLKFGSWTMDSEIMDLNFYHNETSVDLSDFWDLSNWKVLSTTAIKNIRYYECCPEPYSDLTFNLTLRRKPPTEYICSL